MRTGELALVLNNDYIKTREYSINEVILEYAFLLYGDTFDDLIWDMDDENVLGEIKSMCPGHDGRKKWQRVLGLVILWHLEGQQKAGHFLDD